MTAARGFAALVLGSLVGKIAAVAREVIFAAAFGTGVVASGFRVAQTASLVPANLLSGDVLSSAFAPAYSRAVKAGHGHARPMLVSYTLWLGIALTVVAGAVFGQRDRIVAMLAPGASTAVHAQASDFLGVLTWVIPVYGVTAVLAYGLGVHGRYSSASVRAAVQSVGLIGGTLAALATSDVGWLAVGFVLAWVVYLLLIVVSSVRLGLFSGLAWADVRGGAVVLSGLRAVSPLLPLPLMVQASIVLERVVASFGGSGLLAAVDYARTVSDSVVALIAAPLGVIGLTRLGAVDATRHADAVRRMTGLVLTVTAPVAALIAVCAAPIVSVLFERGAFDVAARQLTATVLVGLAVGLPLQILGYSLARALSAVGRNRVLAAWTIASLTAQMVVQLVGVPLLGPIAIGLGPSVAGLVLASGLAVVLGRGWQLGRFVLATAPATAVTAITLVVTPVPVVVQGGVVALAWAVNLAAVRSTREIMASEIPRLVRDALRRSPGKVGAR